MHMLLSCIDFILVLAEVSGGYRSPGAAAGSGMSMSLGEDSTRAGVKPSAQRESSCLSTEESEGSTLAS